ncbi:MAG: hypothetical protein IT493_01090 [Gammaproteobacteria bacterium]|nr:hypothetical protein [Gammaproteobacteria bacterium]
MSVYSVDKLMAEARRLAAEYRRTTGKTLPISGEIAVNDAIRLLGLAAADEPGLGYDATRGSADGGQKLQIKARVVFEEIKSAHRIGELKLDRPWDAVLLVLLDQDYEPFAIYEAQRPAIEEALEEARPNKRGTLTVPRFQRIGALVWSRDQTDAAASGAIVA